MSDQVRVLRILEYVGDRKWVEDALNKSHVPLNGNSKTITGDRNYIKSAVIDGFPEILNKKEETE